MGTSRIDWSLCLLPACLRRAVCGPTASCRQVFSAVRIARVAVILGRRCIRGGSSEEKGRKHPRPANKCASTQTSGRLTAFRRFQREERSCVSCDFLAEEWGVRFITECRLCFFFVCLALLPVVSLLSLGAVRLL